MRPKASVKTREVKFHPSTCIPTPWALRELRKEEPMPIVTKHGDPFSFPSKWGNWRDKTTR
eukprot:6789925-Pyramimonas_sp.AAC.1